MLSCYRSSVRICYSRFLPLRSPVSPVSPDGVEQVVVESPTPYDVPVVAFNISSVGEQLEICNPRESRELPLSSVPLSPNRVSGDFDFGTMDVFPVFTVSPNTDGYLPHISRVSSPGSPVVPTAGSVLDEATGSFHSTLVSVYSYVSVYSGSCRKPAPFIGATDSDPGCGISPSRSDLATRSDDLTTITFRRKCRLPRRTHRRLSYQRRCRSMHRPSRLPSATIC